MGCVYVVKYLYSLLAILFLSQLILFLPSCSNYKKKGDSSNMAMADKTMTVPELWSSKQRYINETVVVTGTIEKIYTVCTGEACPPENRCCNSCVSSLCFVISQEELLMFVDDYQERRIMCTGTYCQLECYPFESGLNYTVEAVLQLDNSSHYNLKLLSIVEDEK